VKYLNSNLLFGLLAETFPIKSLEKSAPIISFELAILKLKMVTSTNKDLCILRFEVMLKLNEELTITDKSPAEIKKLYRWFNLSD